MADAPTLEVRRLHPGARLPRRMSAEAAGLDLFAHLPTVPIVLHPGERQRIPTGIVVAVPPGHEGQVRPRSGLAARHGVTVLNAPGTIDSDYRGELQVLLVNHGTSSFEVRDGERIAQLIVAPVAMVSVHEVESFTEPETERGTSGFGSTGV